MVVFSAWLLGWRRIKPSNGHPRDLPAAFF